MLNDTHGFFKNAMNSIMVKIVRRNVNAALDQHTVTQLEAARVNMAGKVLNVIMTKMNVVCMPAFAREKTWNV
jgi:hypothetical protein